MRTRSVTAGVQISSQRSGAHSWRTTAGRHRRDSRRSMCPLTQMRHVSSHCCAGGSSRGPGGGGGGLVTVPALLAAGLPAHLVLGTNKGQSVFGSFASMLRYRHGGLVDRRRARWTWPAGLLGATVGALATFLVPNAVLKPL